jgi:hypothetical protein
MNKNAIIFYWPLFIVGVCNDAAAHIVIRLIGKLIFCNMLVMMMIIIIYSGLFMTPSLAHNS